MAKKAKNRRKYRDGLRGNEFSSKKLLPFSDPKVNRFLETVVPVVVGWRIAGKDKFFVAEGQSGICMSVHSGTRWLSLFMDKESFEHAAKFGGVEAEPMALDLEKALLTTFKVVMQHAVDGIELSMFKEGEQVVSSLIPFSEKGYKRYRELVEEKRKEAVESGA